MNESLQDFLQWRRKKKMEQCGPNLLQKHITDFFDTQKNRFAGAKIDVQVTVKGDVDFLSPMKNPRKANNISSTSVKTEEISPQKKAVPSDIAHDEDIIEVRREQTIVEIELSDAEEDFKKENPSESDEFHGIKEEGPSDYMVKKEESSDGDWMQVKKEMSESPLRMKQEHEVKFEDGIDFDVKSESEEMEGMMKLEVKMEETLSKDSSMKKLCPSPISQLIQPPVFKADVGSLERRIRSSISFGESSTRPQRSFLDKAVKNYGGYHSATFGSLWKTPCSTVTDAIPCKQADESTNPKLPSNISGDNLKDTGNEAEETKSTSEVPSLKQLCTDAHPWTTEASFKTQKKTQKNDEIVSEISLDTAAKPSDGTSDYKQPAKKQHFSAALEAEIGEKSAGELSDDDEASQSGEKTSKTTGRFDENSATSDVHADDKITIQESPSKEVNADDFVDNSNIPDKEVDNNTSYVRHDSSSAEEDNTPVSDDDDLEKLLGSGQEGNDFNGQDMKLLGSEDSIHTISTGEAEEAVQIIDNEEYSSNIAEGFAEDSEKVTEDTLKSSQMITPIPPKGATMVDFSKSSENSLNSSESIEISTSPESAADNSNLNIPQSSLDPSVSPFEDSAQSHGIQVIPPDGTIMVDFNKSTPVKVTIDVRPNDSVSAKLKQISSIATEYTNTPNKLAQDLIKSHNMSVDYRTHGESIGVTQISASLSNTNYEGDDRFKLKKMSSLEMHTAAAAPPKNIEDDLLGQSDDPQGDYYMDKDTEDRLLRNESPTQDMDNKGNTVNPKRKKMSSEDEDSSNTESAPMKKKSKTLGVCRKKTSGAANYGKSAKLPAFSSLSKSILQKKIKSNEQSSSSSTSPSDDEP